MLPTVAEVLALDPLRRGAPRVVAAADGLDAPVRWVHVIELAEAAHLLRGGELVLATGIALPDDPSGLTRYVAEMHAAWLAFLHAGRSEHPELRIVFSMLAGLAPLHAERLASRGGPDRCKRGREHDPLTFYDTSSYGPDRPVVEPTLLEEPAALDWDLLADTATRVFGSTPPGVPPGSARPTADLAAAVQQAPIVPVARVEALR